MQVPPMLRPATPEDESFLRELFRETRAAEFAALSWAPAQVAALCNLQFDAQAAGYRTSFPQARHLIICDDHVPAGRMIKAETGDGLLLVDLALLPAFRNRGWGSQLVRSLQEEARNRAVALFLQVDKNGPAQALYRRLGFTVEGDDGVRYTMRWVHTSSFP